MSGKWLKGIKETILDILFPKFCFGCGKEGEYLCSKCFLFLSETNFICPDCEKTEYFGRRHKNCRIRRSPDGMVSLWDYEGVLKKMILEMKYGLALDVLKELAPYGIHVMEKDEVRFLEFLSFLQKEGTIFTYVPLFTKREKERGFNQAELISKHFSHFFKKETLPLLKKEKETQYQVLLSREERFTNVKGAFTPLFKKDNAPQRVILVDDVWTSGATMKECCRILKENGVKEVWGFTLSKTN